MAHPSIRNFIAIAGISALADMSSAAQPPCATSDGTSSTACGSYTLVANTGYDNTASGYGALYSNTTGGYNTANGAFALTFNQIGNSNTASGYYALYSNTGAYNTASGAFALYSNTAGTYNIASGVGALYSNTTGSNNTASGLDALYSNSIGSNITAVGFEALYHSNTAVTTANMTAVGSYALFSNTTGTGNNAQGYEAMYSNTTGSNNGAIGELALYSNTTGFGNNAVGLSALLGMTSGNRNTAVGNNAGLNLVAGNYDTYIGWGVNGSTGVSSATENYVTRIGVTYNDAGVQPFNPTTYISGIYNSGVAGGVPVYVSPSGQLGFSASSERYKTDITSLDANTDKLAQLRPVSFHVKTDPNGTIQYGLIAEEVDKVYPELVIRDADGKIQGVRYDELAPMLLNEVQKQQRIHAAEHEHALMQDAEISQLKAELAEMHAALAELRSRDQLVAQR